jgi:uncharacterized protein YegP (UPF0339 family)
MAKFQIFRSTINYQYYYHLRATGNSEIILRGEGYTTLASCKSGIESVKINSQYDFRYDKLYTSVKQYHFNLKASNGEIIGTSESYTTSSARDSGINLVKSQASTAPVEDLS